MGRLYHAVIPTKRGLVRTGIPRPWNLNFAGSEFWGGVFRDLGLTHDVSDPRIGGGPAVPHIIAGKDFVAAREALPRLASDADFCTWVNGVAVEDLRVHLIPLLRTRNAVALVSEYVDLRGATVEDLETGNVGTI